MSTADINYLEMHLESPKSDFQKLVPLKKTPSVFKQRQSLKQRINTINRWIKELKDA